MQEPSGSDSLKSAAADLLSALTKLVNSGANAIESYVGERVEGSGVTIDRAYDLSGFTGVAIGSAFKGEIARGDAWSVIVTSDDNVIDKVSVTVDEKTLRVKVEGWRVNATKLQVAITMPAIEELAVSGACNVTIGGFNRQPAFAVKVSGASTLKGSISADALVVNAGGASTISLDGAGSSLTLNESGASHVNLANLATESAQVVLSGASHADINIARSVSLVASGASHLTYRGGATLVSSQVSGGSSTTQR